MKTVLLLTAVLLPTVLFAIESIPYQDFITLTDNALDSLDELEAILSNPDTTNRLGNEALNRYDAKVKKFDRYMSARWNLEDKQKAIVEKLQAIKTSYGLYLSSGEKKYEFEFEFRKTGDRQAKEVRELYLQYKINQRQF
jgi:hypothetical protein